MELGINGGAYLIDSIAYDLATSDYWIGRLIR